jgi:hypothetical protein
MMRFMDAIARLGEEADAGGLSPSAMGARDRPSRGKLTVTDGPFIETKELIGGWAAYDFDVEAPGDRTDVTLHAAA